MANEKAISKDYLLKQLRNFDDDVLKEKYTTRISAESGNKIETLEDGLFVGDVNGYSPIITSSVILADNWYGSSVPYVNTIPLDGVTSINEVEVSLSANATLEQYNAYTLAGLSDGGQSEGAIQIKAFKKKPTVDIPIMIIIRG